MAVLSPKQFRKSILCQFIYLSLLGIVTAALFAACSTTKSSDFISQKPSSENCRVIRHMMGETCIPHNPQRVVVLREDTLANSLALGVKPIGSVFETSYPLASYFQGKIDGIESVGTTSYPSIEKILKLKPDLILANSYYSQRIYNQLSNIAPTFVLNIPFPPPSWKEQLKDLAQVLNKEAVSQQLMNRYWERIEKLKQALGDQRRNLTVSIASTTSAYGIWINGEKHFSGEVLRDIGVQRPLVQRGDFFYIDNISKEKISDIDGDILFFIAFGTQDDLKTVEKLKQTPLWRQLSAVQRGRVYSVGGHWSNADIFAVNAILDDIEKCIINAV
jgi:iron complex transport system substrate-binding protein